MKILNIGKYQVFLDDENYEEISQMRGWYVVKEINHNANTDYVKHDQYGSLHRYVLGITNSQILVDHIDRNGLNCQKNNLREVTCSENKRNSNTLPNNKFHFNGLSYEKPNEKRKGRIKVSYQIDERLTEDKYKQKTKSFSLIKDRKFNDLVKEAVLYRILKMREFGYILDERSETIEKECLKENPNMELILEISFKDFEVE